MKLLPIVTLMIAGATLAACGSTSSENRFNETTYADHNGPERKYDRDVVYRSYGYDDPDIVYVQPAYRVVPTQERVIYYYD